MGVVHSTLQAKQLEEIHTEVHTKDGYKKTKNILAVITNYIKQQ